MRNGHPFPTELVAQFQGIAELAVKILEVGFCQLINGCTLMDHVMRLAFEHSKEYLADDGGVCIVHLPEQDIPSHTFVLFLLQQAIDEQHFTKR